jgi:hypothetical protein
VYAKCQNIRQSAKTTRTDPWSEGANSELDDAENSAENVRDTGSAWPNSALDGAALAAVAVPDFKDEAPPLAHLFRTPLTS